MTASEIVVVGQIARDLVLVVEQDNVDTTGGGDAFVATLTWALDRGVDWRRAGQLATAAAGFVARHPGGRPALDRTAVAEAADQLEGPR